MHPKTVTARACEVLQRVPPATEAIHRIGSTEPSAMLFDAMEVLFFLNNTRGGWVGAVTISTDSV